MLIAAWLISVFGTLAAGDSLEFGSAGRDLFTSYFVVLALAIFVVVPYSAYRGLLNERDQTTLELLNITSLSPRQLIWGKLWSRDGTSLYFYSAIAPFIAFTSMLQGFDVSLVAFSLGISILVTLCLTMFTLMLAAIPQNKHLQGLMTGAVFLGLLFVLSMIFSAVPLMLMETMPVEEKEFWIVVGSIVVAGLSFFFLFTQIATAHLTFDADNRSTGIRIACTVQFVLYWSVMAFAQFMLGSSTFSSSVGAPSRRRGPCSTWPSAASLPRLSRISCRVACGEESPRPNCCECWRRRSYLEDIAVFCIWCCTSPSSP